MSLRHRFLHILLATSSAPQTLLQAYKWDVLDAQWQPTAPAVAPSTGRTDPAALVAAAQQGDLAKVKQRLGLLRRSPNFWAQRGRRVFEWGGSKRVNRLSA